MKILEFKSEEDWLQSKKGKFSASNIHRLLTNGKKPGELSVGAKTYCFELFTETISQDIYPSFTNQSMEHGKDYEYTVVEHLNKLYPLDEILHFGSNHFLFALINEHAGASPDVLCLDKFGAEIKCPTSKAIHVDRILNVFDNISLKEHDAQIYAQIQFNLKCLQMDKWLFLSYYEGMNDPEFILHEVEITPDLEMHKLMEEKINLGIIEMNRLESVYQSKLYMKRSQS